MNFSVGDIVRIREDVHWLKYAKSSIYKKEWLNVKLRITGPRNFRGFIPCMPIDLENIKTINNKEYFLLPHEITKVSNNKRILEIY